MNPGALILLMFLGGVALVAVVVTFLFRTIIHKLRLEGVVQEGIIMTESGLEFLRFFGFGKTRVKYADVESVELLPFYKGPIAALRLRYGMSARWIGTRLFNQIVVIKLRGPRMFQYLLATPNDPSGFAQQLKTRIEVPPGR
jgi:hypothetical protein